MSILAVAVRLTVGGADMKYMLLIYQDEQAWEEFTEAERQNVYREYRELIQDLQSRGQFLAGDELQPATTASNVRVRDGKAMVTDGPFAETREQIGGFFMVEVDNLDQATSIAGRIPSARMGAVEVRPVAETEAAATV